MGFARPYRLRYAGELLPRLFNLAAMRRYFSVALSLKSPSPDVIRHPALWCTDFPRTCRDDPSYFPYVYCIIIQCLIDEHYQIRKIDESDREEAELSDA